MLISKWVEHYFEISTLINNVFGNNFVNHPFRPSIESEVEYQRLRSWFFNNHDKFAPIWQEFCLSNGISMDFDGDTEGMEYPENPFLYYFPDNLLDLAYMMGAASSEDIGYLDEVDMQLVMYINERFSYTMLHFVNWIGEFAEKRSLTH